MIMNGNIMTPRHTTMVLLIVLGLTLTLTAAAWAGPCGGGWMGGPTLTRGGGWMGGPTLTHEQAAQIFDLREKFRADTAGLRKQMAVKRAELMTLWRAEKPDEKAILAKKKELNALRDQLQGKAVAMGLQMRQIAPQGRGGPMGMKGTGRPHLGMGHHGCPW